MKESNVVHMPIPPKKLSRQYKKHKYTVTFVPATKKWYWEVEMTHVTKYGEECDTQFKAFRAAEKHIDRMTQLKGVA